MIGWTYLAEEHAKQRRHSKQDDYCAKSADCKGKRHGSAAKCGCANTRTPRLLLNKAHNCQHQGQAPENGCCCNYQPVGVPFRRWRLSLATSKSAHRGVANGYNFVGNSVLNGRAWSGGSEPEMPYCNEKCERSKRQANCAEFQPARMFHGTSNA